MESEFERLRKKVENFPSASAYNRLAELARLNGNAPDAVAICQRCIKEFPRNGQSYVILAEIALTDGRKDDAIQLLKDAVERDTRSYTGHRMLADHFEEKKDFVNALKHLKLIQAFRPTDQGVLAKIQRLQPLATAAAAAAVPTAHTPVSLQARTATAAATAAAAAAPRAAEPRPARDALDALCGEDGVIGAVVADAKGRVLVGRGVGVDQADMLAALATDMASAQRACAQTAAHDALAGWSVDGEQGQIIAFQREPGLTLAVLAKIGVRAALLELRARQALIDLGAA